MEGAIKEYQPDSSFDQVEDYYALGSAEQRAKQAETENEELKNKEKTNPLTGLPNKKALEEFINIFDNRSYDIIATYIDLENFGEINRILGHEGADQKIRDFGEFFKSEIRQSDLLFHLHGDEFVLLSPKRTKIGEKNSSEQGLKRHLDVINENSEVKFGFVSTTFDKNKHPSLSDAINEADTSLMKIKEASREQKISTKLT